MPMFVTEHLDKARLNRRRFFFFTSVFVLTSMATWFVADLYWRDANGLSGLEIALLLLFIPSLRRSRSGSARRLPDST